MVDEAEPVKNSEVITEQKFIDNTPNLLVNAEAVAKRIEEANKKSEELLLRNEAIAARMILSGRSEAGQVQKTAEQVQIDEVKKQADDIINRFRK